jgi:hypothetical protein
MDQLDFHGATPVARVLDLRPASVARAVDARPALRDDPLQAMLDNRVVDDVAVIETVGESGDVAVERLPRHGATRSQVAPTLESAGGVFMDQSPFSPEDQELFDVLAGVIREELCACFAVRRFDEPDGVDVAADLIADAVWDASEVRTRPISATAEPSKDHR